ncbi:MAG TPA: two-component sensor histidine kinase, partial [Mycobacterium sp.]
MSSSPRAERMRALIRSPRGWSLRTRLLVTQVLLLAVVCAGIGVATEFALQRFLMNQLDEQVVEAGRRSTVIFDFGPPPPPDMGPPAMRPPRVIMAPPPAGSTRRLVIRDDEGPGPAFLNAPGQAIRTV